MHVAHMRMHKSFDEHEQCKACMALISAPRTISASVHVRATNGGVVSGVLPPDVKALQKDEKNHVLVHFSVDMSACGEELELDAAELEYGERAATGTNGPRI